ncbi:hypothetical protein [Bacillus taeanensis]|uniref:Spore coat protein YsxE n=1 Tax=Bacillus taeanensis TaxID=273032 RepID=A0A366XYU9_9BACI|nr:hypothetical protein [Bacillus taeanensis]RBW71580.1 hypothetical protein DS031_02195 [Bacillus taeanensis]
MDLDMDNLENVLKDYQLDLKMIEEKHGVYKVSAKEGMFALKKINRSKRNQRIFETNYFYLAHKGFKNIVPIYRTKQNQATVTTEHFFYYLMPWVKYEKVGSKDYYKSFMSDLAEMHAAAMDETFSQTELQSAYQRLENHLKKRKEILESYARMAEKRVYMSPFDYEFMDLFPYFIQAVDRSLYYQHQWYKNAKEKSHYRRAVCHGKLSSNHYCFSNNNRFFISVDHLTFDHPVKDLARAVHSILKIDSFKEEDIEGLLPIYQKKIPLFEDEKELLKAYLIYPKHVFQVVDLYYQAKRDISEYLVIKSFKRSTKIFNKHEAFVNKMNESEHI